MHLTKRKPGYDSKQTYQEIHIFFFSLKGKFHHVQIELSFVAPDYIQNIEYWYTVALVDMLNDFYNFLTEKYFNNYISMPYPTEDNIANTCIKN